MSVEALKAAKRIHDFKMSGGSIVHCPPGQAFGSQAVRTPRNRRGFMAMRVTTKLSVHPTDESGEASPITGAWNRGAWNREPRLR
jgi:hypothetical protein